jgi:ABC-type Fe3+ transport system substrate-binding protein
MHSVTTLTVRGPIQSGRLDLADDSVPFQPGEEVAQLVGKGTLGVAELTTRVAADADGGPALTVTLRNATGRTYAIQQLVVEPAGASRRVQIEMEQQIPVTVPIPLGPNLLAEAFPTPTIGGEKLYDQDLYWVGVVLSSFGIVYNNDVLDTLGVPAPTTWADLTDPRLRGWVALADPGHSGSIAATYNTILRRNGWTDGWRLLREAFANARYFASGASKVPVDVSAGEAAVGMCIDFYGRFQAGAIGGNRVGYVDPPGATAITADPISLVRGAPHDPLALQFIEWLLSPGAQQLWQGQVGTPGGPEQFELRRQPIRRDMYTPESRAYWADPQIDPFEQARPLASGMPDLFGFVSVVSKAMAIDQHDELQAAWAAIQATPEGPTRDAMLQRFHAMPPELTIQWPESLEDSWRAALLDEDHAQHGAAMEVMHAFIAGIRKYTRGDAALEARLDWMLFFRENYRAVQEMAD